MFATFACRSFTDTISVPRSNWVTVPLYIGVERTVDRTERTTAEFFHQFELPDASRSRLFLWWIESGASRCKQSQRNGGIICEWLPQRGHQRVGEIFERLQRGIAIQAAFDVFGHFRDRDAIQIADGESGPRSAVGTAKPERNLGAMPL